MSSKAVVGPMINNVPGRRTHPAARVPGGRVGTVDRVFGGVYAYFLRTGDFFGDPLPVYIVEFAPKELWARAEPAARSSTPELFEAYPKGIA
jgi:hypothetical protein